MDDGGKAVELWILSLIVDVVLDFDMAKKKNEATPARQSINDKERSSIITITQHRQDKLTCCTVA